MTLIFAKRVIFVAKPRLCRIRSLAEGLAHADHRLEGLCEQVCSLLNFNPHFFLGF